MPVTNPHPPSPPSRRVHPKVAAGTTAGAAAIVLTELLGVDAVLADAIIVLATFAGGWRAG